MNTLLQLLANFGAYNTELDITGDGYISIHDILLWLEVGW